MAGQNGKRVTGEFTTVMEKIVHHLVETGKNGF